MEAKIKHLLLEELAAEISALYKSDPKSAEGVIERHLKQRLEGLSFPERLVFVEQLTSEFKCPSPEITLKQHPESEELSHLLSLLLGREFSIASVSFEEFVTKLTYSLNVVFDHVNQMVNVIRGTLLGEQAELETIRVIIGSQLEGKRPAQSLESYLGQIKEAFVIAHRAFQEAAQRKVNEILTELDPAHIQAEAGGRLKFGLLRKAELFEIYKDRFTKCKGWFESGRFTEELLREFEKICQEHYKQ